MDPVKPKHLISAAVTFPSDAAGTRLRSLVGLDNHINALLRDLHLLFNAHEGEEWSRSHYGARLPLLDLLESLVPLFIFEGDVGTGKSELAETIGHALALQDNCPVQMVKMSTQVRGTGYVGQMGSLLAAAFDKTLDLWRRDPVPTLLVIDEADSLLTSRATAEQHHEDKSGVNTILQHLDQLRSTDALVAVIAITNRVSVLDPAVRRRASTVLTFHRPGPDERRALFARVLGERVLSAEELTELVDRSEPKDGTAFTYSDLTQRLLVPALRHGIYRGVELRCTDLLSALERLQPTPTMPSGA